LYLRILPALNCAAFSSSSGSITVAAESS